MSTRRSLPGQDAPIRILVFLCFGLAALGTIGGVYFGRVSPVVLPISVLLLPVLIALSVWSLAGVSVRLTPLLAGVAVALIDLGLGPAQGIALGLKGLAYALAFVVGAAQFPALIRRLNMGETLLLLLAGWSWASAIYSVDWWTSLYTGFGLASLALVIVPLAFLPASALTASMTLIARTLGVLVSTAVAFSIAFPHLATATDVAGVGRMSGLFGSPNSAGGFAGLTLVVNLAWLMWRPVGSSRKGAWLALVFVASAAAMIVLSGSRNAMLSTMLACSVVAAIRWPRAVLAGAVIAALAALVITTLGLWGRVADNVIGLLSRQQHGFDVQNLTGRTEIWRFVLQRWGESPWIGYGLGGSRTVISTGFATFWGKTTGTTHNALLESLLDLGLIGALMLFALVGWVVSGALKSVRFGHGGNLLDNLALPMVTFVCLFGVAEKSFAGTPSTATGGLLLAAALVGASRRRQFQAVAP